MNIRMPRWDPTALASGHGALGANVDIAKIVTFLRAGRRTIICWTVTGLALALVYALNSGS
jgi:hypothetical protein